MYNLETNSLEILNKEDQILWQAKLSIAANVVSNEERIYKSYHTMESDL